MAKRIATLVGLELEPSAVHVASVTTAGGLSPETFTGVLEVWDLTLDSFMQDIGYVP